MPKGNPEGYLKKPNKVEKKIKPKPMRPKARTTTELEKKLKERKKYLSDIEGN